MKSELFILSKSCRESSRPLYGCWSTGTQARSQGGSGGGSDDPLPQLPIPKILFHPLAILFHPLAILFHPWNMWMTSHGQCPRGGGVLVNVQEGVFSKLMTSRGQLSKGGCAWCSTHPSSDPPPPPIWLAGYGPGVHVSEQKSLP